MTNDTVQAPTPAQLKALAGDLGFDLSEAELAAFGELMGRASRRACAPYTRQKAVILRWPTGIPRRRRVQDAFARSIPMNSAHYQSLVDPAVIP